jgi:predicted P-loop ATPase
MSAQIIGLRDGPRGEGRALRISTGKTVTNNRVSRITPTWPEFVEQLKAVVRTPETLNEYFQLGRPAQDKIKDVGYFVPGFFEGNVRKARGLEERNCITLDGDHAGPGFLEDVRAAFAGYEYVLHTTHKHTPAKPRFRLVFPLIRAVSEAEYPAAARMLASRMSMDVWDDTTYQFGRVMHFASASLDGEFVFDDHAGKWVDPDDLLAEYLEWRDVMEWPKSSRVTNELRVGGTRAENPLEKKGPVGDFCRAYSIHEAIDKFIPERYLRGNFEDRMTYFESTTSNGAVIYDGGLFLYSHHESDPCSGKNVNSFDLIRLHLFGKKDEHTDTEMLPSLKPSYKAMLKHIKEDERFQTEARRSRYNLREEFDDFDDAPEPIAAEPNEVPESQETPEKQAKSDYLSPPDLRSNAHGSGETLRNLEEILTKNARTAGKIRYNEFTREVRLGGKLPGLKLKVPDEGMEWPDIADLALKLFIEKRHNLSYAATAIREGVMVVAQRQSYHPVREYFDSLEWDGVERLDTLLIRTAGAADTPFHRAACRKTFTAAVARIYVPGTKFDQMLVLEGGQGIGKSTFWRVVARGWFSDGLVIGSEAREVIEQTKNSMIVEIPELVQGRRAEAEHQKAFISRQTDRARAAYARSAFDYPRQFILVGTTNDSNYLTDASGNRRWWCVKCEASEFDMAVVEQERDQLWAEAIVRYRAGEPLWLEDPSVRQEAEVIQKDRMHDDAWIDTIRGWLDRPIRSDHWKRAGGQTGDFDDGVTMVERDRTCAMEIWTECLGGEPDKINRQVQGRIADAMRSIPGWNRQAVRLGARYGDMVKGFARKDSVT